MAHPNHQHGMHMNVPPPPPTGQPVGQPMTPHLHAQLQAYAYQQHLQSQHIPQGQLAQQGHIHHGNHQQVEHHHHQAIPSIQQLQSMGAPPRHGLLSLQQAAAQAKQAQQAADPEPQPQPQTQHEVPVESLRVLPPQPPKAPEMPPQSSQKKRGMSYETDLVKRALSVWYREKRKDKGLTYEKFVDQFPHFTKWANTLRRWVLRWETHASFDPLPRGGTRLRKVEEHHLIYLLELLKHEPHLYLYQLRAFLREDMNCDIHENTVWTALKRDADFNKHRRQGQGAEHITALGGVPHVPGPVKFTKANYIKKRSDMLLKLRVFRGDDVAQSKDLAQKQAAVERDELFQESTESPVQRMEFDDTQVITDEDLNAIDDQEKIFELALSVHKNYANVGGEHIRGRTNLDFHKRLHTRLHVLIFHQTKANLPAEAQEQFMHVRAQAVKVAEAKRRENNLADPYIKYVTDRKVKASVAKELWPHFLAERGLVVTALDPAETGVQFWEYITSRGYGPTSDVDHGVEPLAQNVQEKNAGTKRKASSGAKGRPPKR